MRTRMMPQSSGFDEMPIPPALILPRKGEEIRPFPLHGARLGWGLLTPALPHSHHQKGSHNLGAFLFPQISQVC